MSYKLPLSLYEPDQLAMSAEELKSLAERLSRPPAKKPVEVPLLDETEALLAELPAAKRRQPAALYELAEQIEKLSVAAPRLTLTLAALPSSHLREDLVKWARTNLTANVLVVFRVNPDLAGGLMMRTTNRLLDCSFRQRLLAEPTGFTEVLRRV
jgi:hypothetical protein